MTLLFHLRKIKLNTNLLTKKITFVKYLKMFGGFTIVFSSCRDTLIHLIVSRKKYFTGEIVLYFDQLTDFVRFSDSKCLLYPEKLPVENNFTKCDT